jgi:hypothetical protein
VLKPEGGNKTIRAPARQRPEGYVSMEIEPTRPDDFVSLYRRAFMEYGSRALWNKRFLETPTFEDALVVARALRIEGDRGARRLAEQIEQACRAAI